MTKAKSKPVKKYRVTTGIEHDTEGWRFEAGDSVREADIPGAPIPWWVTKGVLEVTNGGR